jgi:hypothetical protein
MSEKSKYTEEYLKDAHKFSIFNKDWVDKSEICGCFYCQTVFGPDKIVEWTDKDNKCITALCANCGIDSVIGSNPNWPVRNMTFLAEMHSYWF